jgi:hypothetical protein
VNLENPDQFDTTDPAATGDAHNDQNLTMPLGTGDMPGSPTADPLAEATKTSRFGGGSLIIVVVIIIAVLGLFSMRKLAKVTASTPIDSDVSKVIEDFVSGKSQAGTESRADAGKDDQILDVLMSENYTERQVPLQDVQRNPFIIFGVQPVISEDAPMVIDQRPLEIERRREAMQKPASSLTLKSVLGGSTPLANIGGKIYRVGETVTAGPKGKEIVYRVDKITARSVDLVAEDPEYNLSVTVTLTMETLEG